MESTRVGAPGRALARIGANAYRIAMPNASAAPKLQRTVGLGAAIAVVIGSTIGSGIFRSPAGIADRLPGPGPMLAVWVMGGIFALCGALTLAEVASALPQTGGVYVFVREGWGRLPAFLLGWGQLVMIRASSLGAISITFAAYAWRVSGRDPLDPANDMKVRWTAALAIMVTAFINIVGVRWGTLVGFITTLAKYGGLLFIVGLAFIIGLPETGGHFTPVMPTGSFQLSAFGLALVSTLWAFDGWADLSFAAGEVKDPQRVLPRALIGGTAMVIAIYLLANVAYLSVMPIEEIRVSKLVAADVAQRLIGPAGVVFVSVTVMLSTYGALANSLFTTPRIFFAMAEDGLFFKSVAAVHPRLGTPWVAIALTGVLGAGFVLARSFEQLADAFVTSFLPFYALAVASVFVLRRRPDYKPSFRVPGYPVVPLLFVGSTLFLLGNGVLNPDSRMMTLAVFGVLLAGIPVYYLTVGRPARRG
ncbi:MAG: amino acid permease [Gemmatimonadaceae bacterium]|nr:amino acid permease [Gemmatimonadaceae bacterium]